MDRRMTRAERLRTGCALALSLALGCSVELVGVERATSSAADAGPAELDARAVELVSALDADRARASDALPPAPDEGSTPSACGDAASLPQWTDPQRPARSPGQLDNQSLACPAREPVAGDVCDLEGQQCDYPVCWGRGKRSWVCVEQRFTLWFDESFLCAPSRPCPEYSPNEGDVCCLSIECVYSYFCCKGPTGFQAARCDGQWRLSEPVCAGC